MIGLLAALSLAGATLVAPPRSLGDIVSLLEAGVPGGEVAARIEASGVYIECNPEAAVRLYFAGVPAPVLAAVFASSGARYPEVIAGDHQVELLYPGYRIIGRESDRGPVLIVSGYAADGSRLAPPVEPVEERGMQPVARDEWRPPEPAGERDAEPPVVAVLEPEAVGVPAGPQVNVTVQLGAGNAVAPLDPLYSPVLTWSPYFPEYLTVTRVPPAYQAYGSLVLPGEAPAFGFGHYGWGSPFHRGYVPEPHRPGVGRQPDFGGVLSAPAPCRQGAGARRRVVGGRRRNP